MRIEEHEKIIETYDKNREVLFGQIKDRIKEMGTFKVADIIGKSPQYVTDLKHDRKYVSYELLVDMAKKLLD